jgi:hypothetical protein
LPAPGGPSSIRFNSDKSGAAYSLRDPCYFRNPS